MKWGRYTPAEEARLKALGRLLGLPLHIRILGQSEIIARLAFFAIAIPAKSI